MRRITHVTSSGRERISMSKNYQHFLQRFHEYRISQNMTQEELSSKMGIGQSQLCKIENGALNMSYSLLQKLERMSWSVDYLITGEVTENEDKHLKVFFESLSSEDRESIQQLMTWIFSNKLKDSKNKNLACELAVLKLYFSQEEKKSPLYYVREYMGLSQIAMAERIGVNIKKYGKLERNVTKPDAEILYRIYEITGCRPGLFFREQKIGWYITNHMWNTLGSNERRDILYFLTMSQKVLQKKTELE